MTNKERFLKEQEELYDSFKKEASRISRLNIWEKKNLF